MNGLHIRQALRQSHCVLACLCNRKTKDIEIVCNLHVHARKQTFLIPYRSWVKFALFAVLLRAIDRVQLQKT